MKYIRTKKYGVCKVTNEDKNTLSYENSYVCGCLWKDGCKDKIQYADTIEELCDDKVAISKVLGIRQLESCIPFEEHKKCNSILDYINEFKKEQQNTFEIYGAIWTDKGLIYVAKMNDKGELELL